MKKLNKIFVVAVLMTLFAEAYGEPPTLENKFVPVQKTVVVMPENQVNILSVNPAEEINTANEFVKRSAIILIAQNLVPPVKKVQDQIDLGLPKIKNTAIRSEKVFSNYQVLSLQKVGIENNGDTAVSRAKKELDKRNKEMAKPIELACK
ncbi:MAG: hypothetical protein PHE59_02145 [Patescibacteria group bacterium]|nr:hypothetical protein [Patescibacteria group bacterium]MDD5164750.1 hypothetical protein [Patescibacteria group bacterium]MDD5534583.1 hypothetical protein [Patescibacteria group bacterium]